MELIPYEDLLVDEILEKHICPVCSNLLSYPLQCRNGHVCCKSDWNKILNKNRSCFLCKCDVGNIDTLSKNIYIENEIRNLVIYCPNSNKNPNRLEKDEGCKEQFKIDTIETHLKICLFGLMDCENSKECGKIKKSEINQHREICQNRIIKCECNQDIKLKDIEKHKEVECSTFKIKCEHCKNDYPRGQLKSHIDSDCLEVLVDCIYSKYSCDVKVPRGKMDQHLKEVDHCVLLKKRSDHLELMLLDLQNSISQYKELNEANLKLLKLQIGDLNNKKKFSSKWNIRNWSDKVKKYKQGQSFNSSVFNYSNSKKFYLKVFPNGEHDSNFTIALCKYFDSKAKINFTFEIQNVDTTKSKIQEETFLFAKGNSDYYTMVFYDNFSQEDGFIINNTLIIGFNIEIEKIYGEHLINP